MVVTGGAAEISSGFHKLSLQGVLKMGQEVEVRPGIVTKDAEGRAACLPIYSRIVSLKAEDNALQYAVPGGLIGVGMTVRSEFRSFSMSRCNSPIEHQELDQYRSRWRTTCCSALCSRRPHRRRGDSGTPLLRSRMRFPIACCPTEVTNKNHINLSCFAHGGG